MKFTKKLGVLCVVVALAAAMLGFAVNAMAADEYLTSLTVMENGSASNSQTVATGADMSVSVGSDCNTLKINATCKEGYDAVVKIGSVEYKLNEYEFTTNKSVNELEIIVKSTDEDSDESMTYNLTVYKVDTSVKTITVTDNNNKTYNASKSGNNYSVNVASDVTSVTVSVTANDGAKVEFADGFSDAGVIEFGNSTSVKAYFNIISEDIANSYTGYTLTVTKSTVPVNDASLKSLTASKGSVSSTSGTYKITVPYSSSTTTINAVAKDSSAKVLINKNSTAAAGDFTSASTGSYSLTTDTLSRGSTVKYYVHVLAADGTTVKNYTVNVYRSNAADSDEDRLSRLSVKYGSSSRSYMPSFDADTTDYYLALPYDEDEIKITPTAKDSNADITVDGYSVSSGSSRTVDLSKGSNSIKIKVTSSDGTESQTYYLNVYRATKTSGDNYKIDDVTVKTGKSSSSLTKASLNKTFSGTTYTYNVETESTDKYFAVNWEPEETSSVAYLIYGDTVKELEDNDYTSSIKISSSDDYFVIRAYSPNCEEYKDYKFYLEEDAGESDNAYLSGLTVRVNGTATSLSPAFSKTTTNYTVTAPTKATSVTITPTAADSASQITVNGVTVKSGGTSAGISLNTNSVRIPIVVTAEDDSTYRYYVTVNKSDNVPVGDTKIVLKINSTKYTVNGAEKTLLAAPYMDTVNSRTLVPIRAISESLGATVDYNGSTKLITVKLDGKTLTMTLGKEIKVGGLNYGTPGLKNGTTFVPIRYVSEQLGAKVVWDNIAKTVTVTK